MIAARYPGSAVAQGATAEPDVRPWSRSGLAGGAIWLVFLIYPLMSVVDSDAPANRRVVGALGIAAFAATYLRAVVRTNRADSVRAQQRESLTHLVVMALLTALTGWAIGLGALGMLPFLTATALINLSWAAGGLVFAACLAVAVAVPLVAHAPEWLYLLAPLVVVTLSVAVVRVLDGRAQRHRRETEELTLAAERDRVARDVHDVLGHSLTVVTIKAELAERLVEADPARARAELADIQRLSRTALAEVRATVAGLRVATLTDELAQAQTALAGAGVRADLPDDPTVVDPRHRITAAWALREAVTNVVRHSGARTCQVRLGPDWLSVVDDGRGLDGTREGHGLRGLRERVSAVGGTVELGPGSTGDGTRLQVRL